MIFEGRMRAKVQIEIRTELFMEDNIVSNQCFFLRYVSGVLFGNTNNFFSSDWELVLSSRVIQLRSCITWLTHVPHAELCNLLS